MRIQDYINVIMRRWWIVVLVTASAAVAAYAVSKLQTPIYRSQAIYSVWVNRADSGANAFAAQLLNSYVNKVYQPDQLQAISDRLKLDQSGQSLMQYVRVQPQPTAMEIVIEADYFDPATAQQLAAAVGDQLNAVVVERNRTAQGQDRVNVDRAQSAKPAWKAKPNTKINVVAAALLGGVLGLLLSFALEYLDDTLKNPADVERFAGLATIGAIPASAGDRRTRRSRLRPAPAGGVAPQSPRLGPPSTQKKP